MHPRNPAENPPLLPVDLRRNSRSQKNASCPPDEVAFGSQIRSYVIQPYQMIKDLRTGVQTSGIQDVMDRDIDEFIEGKLRGLVAGESTDIKEDE